MTRIVRFERLDGDLILRVPADVAARLGIAVGDEASVTTNALGMVVETLGENERRDALLRRIFDEDAEVLASLAR